MVILWAVEKYVLGWFQIMTIATINLTAFLELLFTVWIRYLVNKRYSGYSQPVELTKARRNS
jgi:hypothetical protein